MIPILLTLSFVLQGQLGTTFGNVPPGNGPPGKYGSTILEQVADKQLGEIVSNDPDRIRPNRPFTLLMIYDPTAADQSTQWLTRALQAPQSPELLRWIGQCDVRGVSIDSPHAEKLRWHIDKHQQLPILMLQESPGSGVGEGATWFSCAGPEIPLVEQQLAVELDRWRAATILAKKQSPQVAQQSPTLNNLPTQAPQRRPLFNPKIDVDIDVPDTINTKVEASLRADTLRGLVIGGFVLLSAALSIAYAMIHAARIIGEAITEDPSQEPSNGP